MTRANYPDVWPDAQIAHPAPRARHIPTRVIVVLGLTLGTLAGCANLPKTSKVPNPAQTTTPQRTQESLQLERYYANVQRRFLAQGLMRTDDGSKDAPFNARTLVKDFLTVALRDEYSLVGNTFLPTQAKSYLRRWEKPVRIGIVFDPLISAKVRAKDRADLKRYTQRLARLSGLSITITDKNPNFTVLFLYKGAAKKIGPLLRKRIPGISNVVVHEIENSPRNTFCVTYAFSDESRSSAYTSAVILIKAEHSDLMRLSCIHEEVVQALGLANDSPNVRPSLFNDDEEFALLTRHDELLLKMLYDKRLKPGMTAKDVRPILPAIARDVLKGNS